MLKANSAYTRLLHLLLAGSAMALAAALPAAAQDYEMVEFTTAQFTSGTTAGTPIRLGNFKTSAQCTTALADLWNGDASRWTSVGVSGNPTLGGEKPNSFRKDGGCFHVAPTTLTTGLTHFTLDAFFQDANSVVTVREVEFQTDTLADCQTIQTGTGALSLYLGDWAVGAIGISAQCN
jgi:hypothetical protein